jgi:hypothetical protein
MVYFNGKLQEGIFDASFQIRKIKHPFFYSKNIYLCFGKFPKVGIPFGSFQEKFSS